MNSSTKNDKNYIRFQKKERDPAKKTDVYILYNEINNACLGSISWFPSFRKYSFAPNPNMVFDAGCLRHIASFLDEIMRKHKESKK